jgi:ABC-2 type transport system ATP-binding protein
LAEGDSLAGYEFVDGRWQTEVLRESEMPGLLRKLVEEGHDVYEALLIRPTLEDIYFKYTERQEVQQ